MQTLTAAQAAAFLNMNIDTLRARTKAKKIPGAKVGRAYVYVDADLLQYLRTQYAKAVDSEGTRWGSTKDPAPLTTGFGSATAAQKLDRALARATARTPSKLRREQSRRGSSTTALV